MRTETKPRPTPVVSVVASVVPNGATLDTSDLYNTWSGLVGCVGHDEKGREVDANANVLPETMRLVVNLQDGRTFNEAGQEVYREELPAEVKAWLGSLPRVPGITAEARLVMECPLCGLHRRVRRFFEKHLAAHDLSPERIAELLAQVDGGAQHLVVPWDEGDFAEVPQQPMPEQSAEQEQE